MNQQQLSPRISAVIFDLDDTLIDWSPMIGSWEDQTRRHLGQVHAYLSGGGHELPEKRAFGDLYVDVLIQSWNDAKKTWAGVQFAQVLGKTLSALGLDLRQIDIDEVMRAYAWQPMPGVAPFDDTIPVLDSLQNKGYKIGLITNSMFPMWMRDIELEAYQMIGYFDARITSGDTGYMKPHPAIYHKVMELLDTTPERAVFVGDRPANDVAGANDAGMLSVLMSPPHLDRELDGVKPDYTITSLTELLEILESLEGDSHG